MRTFSILRVSALAIALAATAPVAFAQDAGSSASGKRVSIVGGVSQLEPTKSVWADDTQRFKADGGVAPTLSVTYHINDNFGIEAWGVVDNVSHRLTGNAGQGKLGEVESQPYAVSGQYQFGDADQTFRPFVGLGYYEQNFSGEETATTGVLAGRKIGIETSKGAMATIGVDANINERWFARLDARYLHDDDGSEITIDGQRAIEEAEFAPVMLGLGVGVKF